MLPAPTPSTPISACALNLTPNIFKVVGWNVVFLCFGAQPEPLCCVFDVYDPCVISRDQAFSQYIQGHTASGASENANDLRQKMCRNHAGL